MEAPTENDPLLAPRQATSHPLQQQYHKERRRRWSGCIPTFRKGSSIVALVIATVLVFNVGATLFDIPQQRIFEAVLCYEYYERTDPSQILLPRDLVGFGALGGVDEMLCKIDAVQGELATLYGYQKFFDGIPALIMAVPVGWMADRYGRRPLLRLALLSVVLQTMYLLAIVWFWQRVDLRWSWLSSLNGFMAGGSSTVLSNLVFLIIVDVTDLAERTSFFMRLSATQIFAGVVVTPLAALWMKIHPSSPYLAGMVLVTVGMIPALLIPETQHFGVQSSVDSVLDELVCDDISAKSETDTTASTATATATSALRPAIGRARRALAFLIDNPRVLALMIVYSGHTLMINTDSFMRQYCSERYQMTFSDSILLSTIGKVVNTTLLLLVLPWVSSYLIKQRGLSAQRKDLLLSRISFALLTGGYMVIALAPSVPVVSIGIAVSSIGTSAAYLLARSLLTSLVPAQDMARMFSILSVCDLIGGMVGSAGMAELFKVGMRAGVQWNGAPFLLLAAIGLLSTLVMALVRPAKSIPDCSI